MFSVNPDLLFLVAHEQHHDRLQAAARHHLARQLAFSPARRHSRPLAQWAGMQLMALGARWQGATLDLQQPVVLCCGTVCQSLSLTDTHQPNPCVARA